MRTPAEYAAYVRSVTNPAGVRRLARRWKYASYVALLAAVAAFAVGWWPLGVVAVAGFVAFTKEASACIGWAGPVVTRSLSVARRTEHSRSYRTGE